MPKAKKPIKQELVAQGGVAPKAKPAAVEAKTVTVIEQPILRKFAKFRK